MASGGLERGVGERLGNGWGTVGERLGKGWGGVWGRVGEACDFFQGTLSQVPLDGGWASKFNGRFSDLDLYVPICPCLSFSWWTFRIYFFFSARGGRRGSPRRREGGGVDF